MENSAFCSVLLSLFISIHPLCNGTVTAYSEREKQTMNVTLKRQIESVGSHQALISRVSDRVQQRHICLQFHTQQHVSRQTEARLQTDRPCERRPCRCTLHSETMRSKEAAGTQTDMVELFISTHWLRLHHTDCRPPSPNSLNCLVYHNSTFLICRQKLT